MNTKYWFEVRNTEHKWSRNSSNNVDEGYDTLVELLDSKPVFNDPPLDYRLVKETTGKNFVVRCHQRPEHWIDCIKALRALLGNEAGLKSLKDFVENLAPLTLTRSQLTVVEFMMKRDDGLISSNIETSKIEYFE